MTREENQWFAKRVVRYFEGEGQFNVKITVNHFRGEVKWRQTIYNILKRYQATGEIEYKTMPGRPCVKSSPRKLVKVGKAFKRDPSVSVRQAARKLNMSKSTLSDIKVHKLGITARTKKKAPKYVKDQESRAGTGLRKVYRKQLEKILVIDDETYVILDPSEQPGRKFVHAVDHSEVDFSHKFKGVTKFPKKFLVWQAIDESGNVSEPYISSGTMNQEVYLNECLKKRLLPFLRQHHDLDRILFWPDLAMCHYANSVKRFLEEEKVDFLQKSENPPNVPQARGIESFWAQCKRKYGERKLPAKNLHSFKVIWRNISRKVAEEAGTETMDHALRFIRNVTRYGFRKAMTDISNKTRH